MLVPSVSALGLRLSDEEIGIAVGVRLGTTLYEPHLCHHCREKVDARGLHGLVCRGGSGKHRRHSMLNDVIWRALGRAKIPAHKEPLGLSREDGKRPDGVTLIPWTHCKSSERPTRPAAHLMRSIYKHWCTELLTRVFKYVCSSYGQQTVTCMYVKDAETVGYIYRTCKPTAKILHDRPI